ncbi:uncharacterized protein LOC109863477, partial [Pseudomyrmex gracilis]|uniref:uncharacterized protein LOC109863477 n=1 Tax=Pseudomyrmex gracilis TaxID=219809 RepID=UPI000995252F
CIKAEALTELVRRFWEQEELPQASSMTEDEQKCEESFVATHTRNAEGRYVVRLPLVREPPDLSATKQAAMSSLFRMETRFTREPELHTMYSDFMRQYEELAHMSPAIIHDEKGEGKRTCYLPHHGVIRDSSLTTKLRVVFNGSQLVPSGESLNANLRIGENLLPALTDILLQWRAHRFVLATDIEKMYRQILIHPDDRDLQRILWRYDATEKVQDYKLNTVTYGLACAPFLALRTLQQLAQDEEQNFPLGAAALKKHVYVDDILTGADTMKETQELQKQLLLLCKAGGFPLKKWTANHEELLESVPEEDRMPFKTREWQPRDCQAMLGVRWNPNYDSFAFTVKDSELKVITKRTVLSKTAQLFDPLGWLAPVVIQAKILIQTAWIKGLGWDTPLDTEDTRKWQKLQEELPSLERVRVPRWMPGCKADQVVELHGFADASERAYAAVVYLRSNHNSPCFKISLIAAKTKVAPLKQVSLPRLELSAATLLAQLITYLQRALSLTKVSIHVWLDSTVALSWVQGHPSKWKTFVANRVAEIQRLLPEARWHHVRSRDNPADCASRGVSPSELVNHHLWWQGPTWLSDDE